MFKKEEIKEYLKNFDLEKGEYILIAGGSLVMHGIKDETEDIDLYISEKQFEKLKEKYNLRKSEKEYENLYEVNDNLEVRVMEIDKDNIYIIDGMPCNSLLADYKWKKENNREKDRETIKKEEELFKNIAKFYNCSVETLTEEKIEEYINRKINDFLER